MERPRKLFNGSICNFEVSKICKKGYIEMTKKIYPENLKSVLGRSIFHYCFGYVKVESKFLADRIRSINSDWELLIKKLKLSQSHFSKYDCE